MKRVIVALMVSLMPSIAMSVPAFVQSNSCASSTTSVGCAFSEDTAADSTIVVCAAASTIPLDIECSDNQAGGYTKIFEEDSSNNQVMAVFVSTGASAAATTVTCTSAGAALMQVAIHEYSGIIGGQNPVDEFSVNSPDESANPTSGEMTTTTDGSLVFSCSFFQGGAASAGSGTERTDYVNNWYSASQDEIQTSAGAITSDFTAAAGTYVMGQISLIDADFSSLPQGFGWFR